MKIPFSLRCALWRERQADRFARPVCWVTGHRWAYKMDLRGGALCGRCGACLPADRRSPR